jgi:excinuclease UvrABC helicase subunit UvrB
MPVHFDLVSPFQPAGDQPAAIEMRAAFGEESLT